MLADSIAPELTRRRWADVTNNIAVAEVPNAEVPGTPSLFGGNDFYPNGRQVTVAGHRARRGTLDGLA